jgi:hypothetical protein
LLAPRAHFQTCRCARASSESAALHAQTNQGSIATEKF